MISSRCRVGVAVSGIFVNPHTACSELLRTTCGLRQIAMVAKTAQNPRNQQDVCSKLRHSSLSRRRMDCRAFCPKVTSLPTPQYFALSVFCWIHLFKQSRKLFIFGTSSRADTRFCLPPSTYNDGFIGLTMGSRTRLQGSPHHPQRSLGAGVISSIQDMVYQHWMGRYSAHRQVKAFFNEDGGSTIFTGRA